MKFEEIKQLDNEYIANTYARFDVAFKEGKGSKLYDYDGKEYIDLASGIGVSSFGNSDDKWVNDVTNQINTLTHTSNLYYTLPQAKLAKMLCEKANMKKVFFANSGAEANEGAIKCARKYSFDKYGNDRYEIITLKDSFHGRTMATLSATGQDVFHKNFNPFLEGFKYVTANDIEDMEKAISDKTCAIMLEIVQGEGGIKLLDKEYVKTIEKIAREKDLILIIDEVQTGNGRTGYLYSYMAYEINPDIVTTAKGLAGALPFGAVLFNEKCQNVLKFGDHGSTFGGNPICATAALSVLSRINEELLQEVKAKSQFAFDMFKTTKNVISVSGMGLMIGIETTKDSKELVKECLKRGVVCLTAKQKLRLLPPLNIPMKDFQKALQIIKEVIEQ